SGASNCANARRSASRRHPAVWHYSGRRLFGSITGVATASTPLAKNPAMNRFRFALRALAIVALAHPLLAQPRSGGLNDALRWRSIGPYRGGRVTAVAGIAAQPLTYYMGATGGGVWKTDDAGV